MKLFYSATSPFVRKVMICLITRGIEGRVELHASDPHASPADLLAANPLSKVPCLVTDDGVGLFDSPVICEYLDSVGDAAPMFPGPAAQRWTALRLQALGDGMADAAFLRRMDQMRPVEDARSALMERQKAAVARGLAALEAQPPVAGHMDIGAAAIVAALGYLDFRSAGDDWRAGHPRLAAWYATVADLPAVARTIPA